jgi:hypothetical protein
VRLSAATTGGWQMVGARRGVRACLQVTRRLTTRLDAYGTLMKFSCSCTAHLPGTCAESGHEMLSIAMR